MDDFLEKYRDSLEKGAKIPPYLYALTPRAAAALTAAFNEARRLGHNFLYVEHIALGLCKIDKGRIGVLECLATDQDSIVYEIEERLGVGAGVKPEEKIPVTKRTQSALERAAREAMTLGHTYIGTEHLVMAILADGGIAATVLVDHDVSAKALHERAHTKTGPVEPSTERKSKALQNFQETVNSFNPGAIQAITLARQEARRLNHNFVGTEHLLLGLIMLDTEVSARILKKAGWDKDHARRQMEQWVGRGHSPNESTHTPFTPRVKKICALAGAEAMALGHTSIGPEHILLALLREGEGVAGKVLKQLGFELESLRQQVFPPPSPDEESKKNAET